MSSGIIIDGTGAASRLKVDSNNRAHVLSTSQTRISDVSSRDKQAYVVATGFISYTTTASFSGMLYIKNTDTQSRDMFIEHIRVCGTCTCEHMESVQVKVIKNPTAGTLISGASEAYTENNNFGSANVFNGLAYKGADDTTVTDGDWFTQFVVHIPGHSTQDYNDSIIIPKGSSIAFMIKPTHESELCMEFNCHFE